MLHWWVSRTEQKSSRGKEKVTENMSTSFLVNQNEKKQTLQSILTLLVPGDPLVSAVPPLSSYTRHQRDSPQVNLKPLSYLINRGREG